MPRLRGNNEMNKTPEIIIKRPHLTVRYTKAQLSGDGALDSRTIFHQLTHNFGFDPVKNIKVRNEFDARYYEQELDEPVDKPMFG
jgi:hypothetical protein